MTKHLPWRPAKSPDFRLDDFRWEFEKRHQICPDCGHELEVEFAGPLAEAFCPYCGYYVQESIEADGPILPWAI